MTSYTPLLRRWFSDHSRSGVLDDADGVGEVGLGASEAGKRLAVRFTLKLEGEKISAVRYQVFGCGFTVAACAAAAALAEGQTVAEAETLSSATVASAIGGLPAERSYCGDLAVQALRAALSSTRVASTVVESRLEQLEEHHPRVTAADPVYSTLMASRSPSGVAAEDRHLFACALAVACREPFELAFALGISDEDIAAMLTRYFPGVEPAFLLAHSAPDQGPPPEINSEVLKILLDHVPQDSNGQGVTSAVWLAKIIAARAAQPGHLWTAMGLFERPQISAAIRRHLPSLAAANNKGMRWKRFLFKQVCDLHGAVLCKSPNCGVCSDYELCFPKE